MHTDQHAEVELELIIERKVALADGVVELRLHNTTGAELPVWEPGSHIDLVLGEDMVRQYSLCSDPSDLKSWHVAVLREPAGRGASLYIHDQLEAGQRVQARGPRNLFPLLPSPRYVFIGGGIGITPLIPMIAEVDRGGAQWQLVYGGRSSSSMAYRDRLREAYGARIQLCPQDETGLLDLAGLLPEPAEDTLVYCCGPEPLLQAVERQCDGWAPGALRVERFSPKEVGEPVRAGSFEVELAHTGLTLVVQPGQSILEAVEAAGIEVASSCSEGTCGTCETQVLAGVPDHRDSVLDNEEQEAGDTMMICVSRAVSPRLVLAL